MESISNCKNCNSECEKENRELRLQLANAGEQIMRLQQELEEKEDNLLHFVDDII